MDTARDSFLGRGLCNSLTTVPVQRPEDCNRTELGFSRTVCDCEVCKRNCRFVSGMLIPADVGRIASHLGYTDLGQFALDHLQASPGAQVVSVDQRTGRPGRPFRIHTLVPARLADGSCHWLDDHGRCTIHAVAPAGCAFFDHHMSAQEGHKRSSAFLKAIQKNHNEDGDYSLLWHYLHSKNRTAEGPGAARAKMGERS